MAIAHVATEYVFSDFLLKEPSDTKYKGLRLELASDKLVTFIGVGLPLLLISLAFAQEVSVGTQISCFSPTNFSWRQAAYVDAFCWAALQHQKPANDGLQSAPLWLHKFFPYILLLVAILMYIPAVFWRFTAAPHLSSDLSFIMEELDRTYNRAIRMAKNLASSLDSNEPAEDPHAALELTEGCFKYPLVEQYLKTKRLSRALVLKYVLCRALTLLTLLLACLYLGYYIRLASSSSDEFSCDIRSGVMRNDSTVPAAIQCKLVAVGVFRLLSCINLAVYLLLGPVVVYATTSPVRQGSRFLRPYEMLPAFGTLDLTTSFYDDLSIYLLFLEENLSELKSYKCLQVLELLREGGGEAFDTMCLLRTLGQVKTDVVDKKSDLLKTDEQSGGVSDQKDAAHLLIEDGGKADKICDCKREIRQRVV
ncbi:pannexin-1-like [Denticeps clupeoides]|uniref:Pannexin n=1 Tax=Denticeps clupeoides TaxID=299321 RepID=A0AAY4ALG5_9TELE|nr:pannexin-1-like [Denticeps clupeoides]